MLIEIRQFGSEQPIDRLEMEDPPHPGRWFSVDASSFLVMQRRHRYRLRSGRYELSSVVLLVQSQKQPDDARWYRHGWVIGDPSCRFNARSPVLRCAVLPEGPCDRCVHREAVPSRQLSE